MTEKHMQEHQEMLGLANAILGLAVRGEADRTARLAGLRLAFSRLVNHHCDEEAALVRDAVARGLISRQVVTKFGRDLISWRADLALCNSEWPLARILTDPKGFAQRFGALTDALRDYVAREDREILSVIGRFQVTRRTA